MGNLDLCHLSEIRRFQLKLCVLPPSKVTARIRSQRHGPRLAFVTEQSDSHIGVRARSLLVACSDTHVVKRMLLRRRRGSTVALFATDRGSQCTLRQQNSTLCLRKRVAVMARLRQDSSENQVGLSLELWVGRCWTARALHFNCSLELMKRGLVFASLTVAVAFLRDHFDE